MTAPLRNQLVLAPENIGKIQRTNSKFKDMHDQESFRKSGLLYSAFQSPIQYCVVTASDTEISSLLNRNFFKRSNQRFSLQYG